jgi:hypothetical protein
MERFFRMNALTTHAEIRCQQRGIPPLIVEWLLDFGTPVYNHGAEIYRFDKKSKKAIKRYAGKRILSMLEQYMDAYLVFADGRIITAGHRYKRIHTH